MFNRIACVGDNSQKAISAYEELQRHYQFVHEDDNPDVIIALGGDGFMLHTLHRFIDKDIPIYGMHCGTVGFLMNELKVQGLEEALECAKEHVLNPLKMIATTSDGQMHEALAINEVSMLRQTRQAARLRIHIDGKVRMEELMCDGILLATAVGSTAYNLSVQGPILPVGCDILALTPISPFRPRRWNGALLPHKARVDIEVLEDEKRPVSAVADFTEVRRVQKVSISQEKNVQMKLLFDKGHSWEERIIKEQFTY